ncbi:MAG TPA: hypothetical protein PKJ95_02185 [Atribacterota bacterium]|nr:hypothetical protein [Atribacterota bacterium]
MSYKILRGRGLISMTDPNGKKIPFGRMEEIAISGKEFVDEVGEAIELLNIMAKKRNGILTIKEGNKGGMYLIYFMSKEKLQIDYLVYIDLLERKMYPTVIMKRWLLEEEIEKEKLCEIIPEAITEDVKALEIIKEG